MQALHALESFGRTVNDIDDSFPKGRGRCFDIGIWGGCGVTCPAFVDGECEEPQECSRDDVLREHCKEDAEEIFSLYECFKLT